MIDEKSEPSISEHGIDGSPRSIEEALEELEYRDKNEEDEVVNAGVDDTIVNNNRSDIWRNNTGKWSDPHLKYFRANPGELRKYILENKF